MNLCLIYEDVFLMCMYYWLTTGIRYCHLCRLFYENTFYFYLSMWTVSLASMAQSWCVSRPVICWVVEGLPQGGVEYGDDCTYSKTANRPIVTNNNPPDVHAFWMWRRYALQRLILTGRFRAMGVKLSLCLGLHDNRNATGLLMDHFSIKASKDKLFELEIKEGDEDKLSVKDTSSITAAPYRV